MLGGRWNPSTTSTLELPPNGEAGAAAARQAVTELFPEISEGFTSPTVHSPSHYPWYQSHSRRQSEALIDPSFYTSSSSYGRSSSSLSPRSPNSERPRRAISPEPPYVSGPRSPPLQHDASYTYSAPLYADGYDDFGDSEAYDDSDDEDAMSAILIRDSAASPAGDTPDPVNPLASKHPSPDLVATACASSSVYPCRSILSEPARSFTSTSPRRSRKPAPTNVAPAAPSDVIDRLLVFYRAQGRSYKSIKNELNLEEAESTLRGRHRTLTKPKSERLRKPVW